MDKLSKILKIDLHIHSIASAYKEDSAIVESSNIDNIDVLLEKLDSNGIGIAAITDHNRFDFELYKALKNKIGMDTYEGSVKLFLPAIEFDVLLEEGESICHIIAVFDDRDAERVVEMGGVIDSRLLTDKEAYYSKNEFESILRDCGLDVILIAHQFVSLGHHGAGTTRSLSESVSDVREFLKVGYISALEYQKPSVEGMLLNSLKEIGETPLIIGSDCHQWTSYPARCVGAEPKEFTTSFKCLPTFKGLLFSITSFKTRINREINDTMPIKSIRVGENEIPLSPSLNAIIGDNGSGKTLLLDMINGDSEPYHKKIIELSDLSVNGSTGEMCYTRQGSITKKAKEEHLFEEKYFSPIATLRDFRIAIEDYFDELLKYVNSNIRKSKTLKNLDGKFLCVEIHTVENFHINVSVATLNQEDNIHKLRRDIVYRIIRNIQEEYSANRPYYEKIGIDFKESIKELKQAVAIIQGKYKETEAKNLVKGYIVRILQDYDENIHSSRNSLEKERIRYNQNKDNFIEDIIAAVRLSSSRVQKPEFPKPIPGNSSKPYINFNFSKKAPYDNKDMKDIFFTKLFTTGYQAEEKVLAINNEEGLKDAINGISSVSDIERWKSVKLNNFIIEWSKEETSITQDNSGTQVGGTAGEQSMAYYKFILTEREECILIIDQPEDDINPRRIEGGLINLLNRVRDEKQIIFATHNPLLVVNLDVDNVIFVENHQNKLSIKSGCLEYETEEYKITNLVELNLDGGREAIERRLKVYGKEN